MQAFDRYVIRDPRDENARRLFYLHHHYLKLLLALLGRGVASTSSGEIQIDPTAHTSALSTANSSAAPPSDPASSACKLDEFEAMRTTLPTTCFAKPRRLPRQV